jgi:hypothetical protein
MKFYRHWAKAKGTAAGPDGRAFELAGWGYSETSVADAARVAEARLQRMKEAVARGGEPLGRYAYGDRPLREDVLEEPFPGAVITRNSYGCEVLNTARAAFIDVDLPEQRAPGLLGRLLGRGTQAPSAEAAAMERVKAWLKLNPEQGFRVYRTRAGLRLLAKRSSEVAAAEPAMRELGADPLYMRLCRAQQSYRARLTPKPWRCGAPALSVEWPFAGDDEAEFRAWRDEYEAKRKGYGCCRHLADLGSADWSPELAAIADLHDTRTGANKDLPLA